MAGPSGGPGTPRIRIDDVAAAAGVSRQTVSNVINGRGRFSDRTRERVAGEVTRLGYHPHGGARSLRSRRSGQLALPLSPATLRPGNAIMAQFLQACIAAAGEREHRVVVSVGAGSIAPLIAAASVDAFLLADIVPADPRLEILVAATVPFACFGRTAPGQPQSWVDLDNVAAVAGVVGHLAALGHRRLAYLGYSGPEHWNSERERGFLLGVRAAGLPVRSQRIHRAEHTTVRTVVERLLHRSSATAVVTGSDAIAAVVYAVAAERGLQVGRDLAVTGVDGGALGAALVPALTTVAIPMDVIATTVVERALTELDGPTGRPGVMVQGNLVVGGSSSRSPAALATDRGSRRLP